ncbi:MAG TPA: heat-inducible transcriptional repressor HrcA [Anaerolineaceae bacterium]|nr:heat-inducible transcriptional repressor HrcA [Anaerolineaceae bacterium]HQN05260.1 heat-inducible transcriptional repressor HrcA [Anaerolineaceae bacterium]HQP07871.1 heat-inducible transcriptional repressor HrcA [Anaerolineaceae bacterium]
MENLTERQKLILSLVIHEYTRSAQPVGSSTLVKRYKLDMSPATVRNEMAALTDMGYLRQPHTSAGRIPSEEGFRFFVGRLLRETELPDDTRHMISHQFYQSPPDTEQWMRLAASVLAHQSRAASLVTAPHPEKALIKHVEVISTYGRQVLMVLVMVGGEIRQRIMTLSDLVPQEVLTKAAQNITRLLQGKDAASIQAAMPQLQGLEYDLTRWMMQAMGESDAVVGGEVYLDGLSNVLAEPEFSDNMEARRALRVLEERSQLQQLLSRTMSGGGVGGVQVLIGGEGAMSELSQFSMVLARYGMPGVVTGMLGVLGPMRMPYGRTISTVRYIAGILSDLVTDAVGDEKYG